MELSFLRAMYEIPGPWASLYIDGTDHTEATAAALKLRWRAARETLLEEGIDEPTLLALEGALAQYQRPRERHGPGRLRRAGPGALLRGDAGAVHRQRRDGSAAARDAAAGQA